MGSIAKLAMTDAKPSGKSRRCMGEVYVYEQNIDTHTCRRTAAEAVDEDIFSQFCMYHVAGLSDFSFMHSVENTLSLFPGVKCCKFLDPTKILASKLSDAAEYMNLFNPCRWRTRKS